MYIITAIIVVIFVLAKPHPWGIKVWCAADPRTGYLLEFEVYQGKSVTPIPNGLGYHTVMNLGSRFLGKGHHFFFDNYFASVALAKDLLAQRTFSCSTVRMNRSGWPKEFSAQFAKKMKAGDVQFRQEGQLLATLWKDKRPVSVLSTNSQPQMKAKERRSVGGKKVVMIPDSVNTYNGGMGGVDLADQHASYYKVGRPGYKWWRYICWWIFNTAMINAFILYKETNQPAPRQGYKHLDFRWSVLESLRRGLVVRRTTAVPLPLDDHPISQHASSRLEGRKAACKVCLKAKRRQRSGRAKETVYGCARCRVHLCEGQCFVQFHQEILDTLHA